MTQHWSNNLSLSLSRYLSRCHIRPALAIPSIRSTFNPHKDTKAYTILSPSFSVIDPINYYIAVEWKRALCVEQNVRFVNCITGGIMQDFASISWKKRDLFLGSFSLYVT